MSRSTRRSARPHSPRSPDSPPPAERPSEAGDGSVDANPFAQLTSYELRHLIAHLAAAEHPDDLARVLSLETGGGRNAWFEAKDAAGDTEGYLADLTLASDGSERRGEVAREILFALSAASIRSLAGNFTPNLYVTLVERGVWRPAQALIYARQQWEARRTEFRHKYTLGNTLVGLAPYLDATLIPTAVDLAREIDYGFDRARPLGALAQRWADEGDAMSAWPLVLEVVEDALWPHEQASLVAHVAAGVPPASVAAALERFALLKRVGSTGEPGAHPTLLAALIPHLPEQLQEPVAAQALEAAREHSPVHVAQVALVLPDQALRPAVIREALRRARRGRGSAGALAAIAPMAARLGLYDEALAAAWRAFQSALRHGSETVSAPPPTARWAGSALFAVADLLPASQRREVHAQAQQKALRARRGRRGWLLAMIANALEPPLREATAEEACELARRSSKASAASLTIVTALPALPAHMRAEALTEAARLDVAQLRSQDAMAPAGVSEESWAAANGVLNHTLGAVAPADRPAVVAEVAARFRAHYHEEWSAGWRGQALAALVPFAAPGQAADLYEEALADAESLVAGAEPHNVDQQTYQRRDVIDAVVPGVPTPRLRAFLRSQGRIEDTSELASAMAAYAPAGGSAWDKALSRSRAVALPARRAPPLAGLAAAVQDEALLTEALDAAPTGDKSSYYLIFQDIAERVCARRDWKGALTVARRADAEGALGNILGRIARTAPLELAPEIEEVARSARDALGGAQALLELSERLDGDARRAARRGALDGALAAAAAGTWVEENGVWIGAVAFALVKEEMEAREFERLAREVLTTVAGQTFLGVEAVVGLAPHLPHAVRAEAEELARGMREHDAPTALAALAATAPTPARGALFGEAWKLALALPDHQRARALAGMACWLPHEDVDRLVTATLALKPTNLTQALKEGVATVLPERQLSQILGAVRNLTDDESDQAEALGAIAGRLALLGRPEEAIETVSGLSTALQNWADSPQQVAAQQLPPVFADLGQWDHAARAAELVPETNGWNDRVRDGVLHDVASRLSHRDARAALLAARRITDSGIRAAALRAVAAALAELPVDQLRAQWADALADLARGARPALLVALASLEPVVRTLDPEAGEEATLAIHDVARWWP